MKYLVETISNYIVNNAIATNDEALFMVNGFEDLSIYTQLCEKITEKMHLKDANKSLTIKLADKKWKEFKRNNVGSSEVLLMEQKGWIANGQSTTYFRNLHNSDVLVLLGTEEEDDAVGSLNEIITITPSNVLDLIDKVGGKTQYYTIFSFTNTFNENEKLGVNNLYKDLFELVSPDIVKLSNFADKWGNDIGSFYDFAKEFFAELPEWGLPLREDSFPKLNDINSKKNVLRQEFNFVNSTLFSPFSASKFKNYKIKIDTYEKKGKKYSSIWEGWSNQGLTSYDDYSDVLLRYISGDKTSDVKKALLRTDFSITEDILGLKLDKKVGVVGEKIYGDPLTAFTKAIMDVMTEYKEQKLNESIAKIKFSFSNANIVTDNDEDEDLLRQWNNICVHTNGVFDYIKDNALFSYDGEYVDVVCEPENYFEISMTEKGYVSKARGNKATNKIEFKVTCLNEDDSIIAKSPDKNCEWIFKYGEDWVTSFTDLCFQDFVKTQNPIIPVSINSKMKSLVLSKSKDDFLQIINDESDTSFDCNLLSKSVYPSAFESHDLFPFYWGLGDCFAKFANELASYGLFNVLANKTGNNTLSNLEESYKRLGSEILKTRVNQNEQYLINYFIHAFNIEENTSSVVNEKQIDYCIVPPWHPASLEKIKHMYRFFMDGCHEYWAELDEAEKGPNKKLNEERIDELTELSLFQNAVDLFPTKGTYFGATKNYGFYTVYSKKDVRAESTFRDLIDKEAIFDDDFKAKSYSVMNDDALMIFNVIENYVKAFPDATDMLNLVFINPSDLQPIIAAVYKYIQEYHSSFGEDKELSINLKVLVKPENMGGKNYLTFWMNETFDLDSNVKIKTYLNVWKNSKELDQYLDANNDIAFEMDLLKEGDYNFQDYKTYSVSKNECYFPIVFRPGLVSKTSVNRVIELTQPQFEVASTHTQVVHYNKSFEKPIQDESYYAVKYVNIDDEGKYIIEKLHEKAYWVVCIDNGLDGTLVRPDNNTGYSVIGFSTGKGKFGQYNITITARNSIVNSIEKRFANRLKKMFGWDDSLVKKASQVCMNEAAYLDGISVLKASNKNDYNINEFMAYVMTALREKKLTLNSPLKTIVHLDSYKHWFSQKGETKTIFNEDYNRSRPDFLVLEVNQDYLNKLKIKATIVECKIAKINNKNQHLEKAISQAKHGVERLKEIFDPNSTSIKRRYWFAQLYRALAFAQITFEDQNPEYEKIADKIRQILDGEFEIEWDSEILGYWVDLSGKNETSEIIDGVKVFNIPQIAIQNLLLNEESNEVAFNKAIDFIDEYEESTFVKQKEEEIEKEFYKDQKRQFNTPNVEKKDNSQKDEASSKNVPFSQDEAILLLDMLLKEKQNNWSRSETAKKASVLLREYANKQGTVVDSSFRSPEGLIGRLRSLSISVYGNLDGLVEPKTKVFEEIADLYKTDIDTYTNRLLKLHQLLGLSEDEKKQDGSNTITINESVEKETLVESPKDDPVKLEDVRVYIGNDKFNSEVYWEFGNPKLANRHLLVTGTSGQGKTYCIQTMLYELSKTNISSVIFDYTEGFRKDQLEPKFLEKMQNNIHEEIVYSTGVPINPFKRHEISISGITMPEKPADVANRIANIFTHVYGFGEQQYAAIFKAAHEGLKKYKDDMNMDYFKDELEKVKSSNTAAKTVLSKMEPFFYTVEFVDDTDFDWGKILYTDKSMVNIFQLTQIDRAIQVIITELMLWDAWYYTQKNGSKDKPFVVILDEAQNLSHKDNSPSAKILTEGRKFGWSAWFATQSLKVLSDEEVVRLMQSSFKIYFKPTDDEITKISKQIDPTDGNAWVGQIKNLTKGKCIVVGDRVRADGTFGSIKPTVTNVESFDRR